MQFRGLEQLEVFGNKIQLQLDKVHFYFYIALIILNVSFNQFLY